MMTGTVLDILIYVFDRYMLDEVPEVPEREHLARDLERVGFAHANVERALDWLADLASERDRPQLATGPVTGGALGIYADCELALDADELDTEQLKWVVLMVLSSQPGQEQAFERLEDLVSDVHPNTPH